jgi:DNA-binding response OmpR family regulator
VGQPTVLVAEDDRDLQEVLWLNLRLAGMSVLTASDGDTALRLAREHRPDVVVLDVMMPGRGGMEVLQELRSDPDLREVPVVVVTACAAEEQIWAGWQAGADHYLTKPVRLTSLVELVTGIVEDAQASRAS